jgi:hypothetical protein
MEIIGNPTLDANCASRMGHPANVFDMETAHGVDHVSDRIHIVDRQIQSIHAFYYSEQTPEGQI